jgi:hypothetical protein
MAQAARAQKPDESRLASAKQAAKPKRPKAEVLPPEAAGWA